MTLRLIPNWRAAWRMFSVQMAGALVAWSMLPPDSQMLLIGWTGFPAERVPALLGILAVVGRLVQQPSVQPPSDT